jgi:hypothetical protein
VSLRLRVFFCSVFCCPQSLTEGLNLGHQKHFKNAGPPRKGSLRTALIGRGTMNKLTEQNFKKGMLIDEEWLAGVSRSPGHETQYTAFVINHLTGEPVAQGAYPDLQTALSMVNRIPRPWRYESTSGCGSPECGSEGQCGTQSCPKVARKTAASCEVSCGPA